MFLFLGRVLLDLLPQFAGNMTDGAKLTVESYLGEKSSASLILMSCSNIVLAVTKYDG